MRRYSLMVSAAALTAAAMPQTFSAAENRQAPSVFPGAPQPTYYATNKYRPPAWAINRKKRKARRTR